MSKNQKKVKINIFTKGLSDSISFYLKDLKSFKASESKGKFIEIPNYNLNVFLNKPIDNDRFIGNEHHYISFLINQSNTKKWSGLIKLLQGNKKWQEFVRPSSGLGKEVTLNFEFENDLAPLPCQ